ncbi:uncharacterized protein VP01_251g4 [Puccinia sorghi]|uniref:Chromo domain-containing protein n=1 Tax=Puccinia sorghi TaxID=27349 RepID=A0A0L6V653_9BASI|nr:uncharacterized protein VP01_251g4 [Puccinia sorghi]
MELAGNIALPSFEMESNPSSLSRARQGSIPRQNSSSSRTHQHSRPLVSCILTSRLREGKLQYLVKWTGYQSNKDQTSWEPANHLQNSKTVF